MDEETKKILGELQKQVNDLREILFKKTGGGPSEVIAKVLSAETIVSKPRTGATGTGLMGFYGATPVVKQTDGTGLTNNVAIGGVTDTIANYTDLSTYANDAAAIRNDIYQLARKVKIIGDALRTYGLLT